MNTIKFNNYGLESLNIDFLIKKYEGKESTKKNIQDLKDEVYDSFINNPRISFSTKGGVSVHIVDLETMGNCEILYN